MFSPDAPPHRHSLRPKRSRNTASDDSIKQPQAKRKRSALRRDTFEPLQEASINEIAGREAKEDKPNGHIAEEKVTVTPALSQSKELTFRGTKKSEKRSERGSGTLVLSTNDFYTVSQLPALPEQIRTRPTIPYACLLSPEYGYALALTHTDAVIWPYNSNATTPSSREVTTFKLPFPSASVSDPLPLAAFTARSAGGEPGIVVVSSKSGKIVYWETITNASSFVPGQTSSGVQGSIPGLLSGETVQELVNAEPAGFVLTFSHGRVAHLTVRDQIGRPAIGVQFLRKSIANQSSGIFGSIRNVFGGDRRKGTPVVRAGMSTKGHRDVLVATEDAELELWSINISVGNALISSLNFKDDLTSALSTALPELSTTSQQNYEILDVEFTVNSRTGNEASKTRQTSAIPVIALVAAHTDDMTHYFIVELAITHTEAHVKVVHPIKCYSSPRSNSLSWRPRLCLLKSQNMAVVVFETALVLFSLAKPQESPSSQLLMEKSVLPDPFQDCVRFQEDTIYKVLGYTTEEQDQLASCLLAVQAFGIVRITSHVKRTDELDMEEFEERVSAKSKIEQAVFFGTMKQNPLDLNTTANQTFSTEEIERAAIDISNEILSSTSKYLPKSAPSLDMQMKLRAKALDDLVSYLMKHYASSLSRNTRFKLLWNAEKLTAAQAIWKTQEQIQTRYPLKDREMSYLDFTLRALHETRQQYPDPEKGQNDRIRHWLVNSVANIDHLISELVSCIPELEPMDVTNPTVVGEYLTEALDLWIAAYEAAFKFRDDSAPLYGLEDEVFQNGILTSGYPTSLTHPWTSKPEPYRFGQQFIYDNCNFLREWWDVNANNTKSQKKTMPTDIDGKPYEIPQRSILTNLASRLPSEVEIFSRICTEENIQAQCQVKAADQDKKWKSDRIAELKAEKRPRLNEAIEAISLFNMPGAIELAEQLEDPGLLVILNTNYLILLAKDTHDHPEHRSKNEEKIRNIQDHAETYFDRFGKGWAFAHFSRLVEVGDLGTMLAEVQLDPKKKQNYLTWFLKKSQKLGQQVGKISWINEVVGDSNYERAEQTLNHIADSEETDLWNKKTELSLAKLAGLAATEGKQTTPISEQKAYDLISSCDNKLSLVDIQQRVCDHILAVTSGAIDSKAAEDLATQQFVNRVVAKSPALKRLLKSALHALVGRQAVSVEILIDFLTLSDPTLWQGDSDLDPEVLGNEFALALRVVDLSELPRSQQDSLCILIWRRVMIRDDWSALNDTTGKNDQQVENEMQQSSLFVTLAHVLHFAQETETEVYLVSPSEILSSEPFPQSLQSRFNDNERDGVAKDLEKEQARLKTFIEKAQLEMHYSGLVTSAQQLVRSMADQEGDEMAKRALEDDVVIVNGT